MKTLLLVAFALILAGSTAHAQTLSQPATNGNGNTVMCTTFNSTVVFNGSALGSDSHCYSLPDVTATDFTNWSIAQCPPIDTGTKDSNGAEISRSCTATEARTRIAGNTMQSMLASVTVWKQQQAAQAAANSTVVAAPTPAN